MRDGYTIFDADTHVHPACEVLDRYVDAAFRPRLAELAACRVPSGRSPGTTPGTHEYRTGTRSYRRHLGQSGPHETFTGRDLTWRGTTPPQAGVMDDQAAARLADMDVEGTDVHFMIPASWTTLVGLDDPSLEVGLVQAFHRFQADFCGHAPQRLRGLIVAPGRDVDAAVEEIQRWGKSGWAAAVMPSLPEGLAVDHPDLEPIWAAAQAHDLPIVHHSVTWNPPYFPGYRDVWDNIFLGRLASHPWGAMRFIAAFIGSGIMDRHPELRVAVLECGFGWLPFWARRMDEQAIYVGGTASLRHPPSHYLTSGRFFCSIEMHEGPEMLHAVIGLLGDGPLMYASDYPHPECRFPNSPATLLAWPDLPPATLRRLLSENATRCFKQP